MIEVGQKVSFDPVEEINGFSSKDNKGELVTGTVVYVNEPHRWFSAQYGKHKMRKSFKFWEIGKAVTVCGKH